MPDTTEEDFNTLAGSLDYPMFVVTATGDAGPAGCLVGFATQCSIAPPRFMVWLSKNNRTYRIARDAPVLAVHVLDRDAAALAELFGGRTGHDTDKFAQCSWRPGPAGVPMLDEVAALFVGHVLERYDTGDHVGFLLRPTSVQLGHRGDGLLTFQDVRDLEPGHRA
ncbi:flavin reductase [Amycolatopsis rhizosphaerae]|uniref:Flavin reductase n=1 Tax=Amycolatopsis rhizosphaerae TaxID=2053003 RepID=A0A558CYD6_9PSEU|nr:flavin reductase family protein [Amycolatopsis rhizosphaerae]TVT53775.1 flavin reductase [Amycolatopsis rhizosphaerae]